MRISDWSSDVCSSDLDVEILGVLVRSVIGIHRLAERLRGRLPVAIMVAIAVGARLALPGNGPELLRHLPTVLRLLTFLCLLTGALGGKPLLTLRLCCIAPIAIDRAAQGGRERMQPARYPLPCIAQPLGPPLYILAQAPLLDDAGVVLAHHRYWLIGPPLPHGLTLGTAFHRRRARPHMHGRLLLDSAPLVAAMVHPHPTSELQSLMRTSYAVFVLKKQT